MSAIKIETTIKGGLPVIATGIYAGPYWGLMGLDYPPRDESIEDIEVRFRSGHTLSGDLSDADLGRIAGEMLDAYHSERYEWRKR